MENIRENVFTKFYREHHISPVRQDISDFTQHLRRRGKLYRQLGIPTMLFSGKNVLEVGSGSGYNTLAFFEWGAHVDIIEPNKKGVEDMKSLFCKVDKKQYNIFNVMLEEYETEKKYDVIIAEGFLPCIDNKKEVLEKLLQMAMPDGIVVVTCVDEMGIFIELMKRLIACIMTKDILVYTDKVKKLAEIFEPQLAALEGVSRSATDWVQDQLINESINAEELFSLLDAIEIFPDEYEILGSSPCLFTDYSWYKDVKYDYKSSFKQQFKEKRHNLLIAGDHCETFLSVEENEAILKKIKEAERKAFAYEKEKKWNYVEEVVDDLEEMQEKLDKMNPTLGKAVNELIQILKEIQTGEVDMGKYKTFFSMFGKSQQYISFVKNPYK